MNDRTATLAPAPRAWTPTAFVAAGLLFAVFATFWIETTFGAPPFRLISGVFGAAGWAVGLLGLLGLHATVAQRSPTLARIGAVSAIAGMLAATVAALTSLGTVVGLWTGAPAWLERLDLIIPIGVFVGFLAYGFGSLRGRALPRAVRYLLPLPALLIVLNLVGIAVFTSAGGEPPAAGAATLSSAQTAVLLSLGLLLSKGALGRRGGSREHAELQT